MATQKMQIYRGGKALFATSSRVKAEKMSPFETPEQNDGIGRQTSRRQDEKDRPLSHGQGQAADRQQHGAAVDKHGIVNIHSSKFLQSLQ
jgi:hypothetical protein